MKQILFLIIVIMSSVVNAEEYSKSCVCKAEVGVVGTSEFDEIIDIKVSIDAAGFGEATGAEADIVVAYKCLTEKNDVRKIFNLKSIKCED